MRLPCGVNIFVVFFYISLNKYDKMDDFKAVLWIFMLKRVALNKNKAEIQMF